ncbi:hypothetical protein [Marinimicrobium locisalis]|uniref:hypothetical protein n=1 Tax=Marinimicrobium locisalis TaxID=546022 RepID=UPI003221F8C7
MRIPSNRWLLCYAACLFGAACDAEQHPPQPVTFEVRSSSEKISDASSPLGYWVQEDSYPVFSGQDDVAAALNSAVTERLDRYHCANGGDESFEMDVETLEKGLVSLRYVAMWHCSTMTSPDSAEGAINRTLPGLNELKLEAQFMEEQYHVKVEEKVRQRYTAEIAQAAEADDCPPAPDWDYFTITPEQLEFHFNTSEPSGPTCAATVRLSRKPLQDSLAPDSPL